VHDFLDRHQLPGHLQRLRITDGGALAAPDAQIAEQAVLPADQLMGLGGTDGDAFIAVNTVLRIKKQLWPAVDGLGIMTPRTAHIAAFQKNGGADARPVVQAEPLDVCNQPFHISFLHQINKRLFVDLIIVDRPFPNFRKEFEFLRFLGFCKISSVAGAIRSGKSGAEKRAFSSERQKSRRIRKTYPAADLENEMVMMISGIPVIPRRTCGEMFLQMSVREQGHSAARQTPDGW
jgi:hypothetical protein